MSQIAQLLQYQEKDSELLKIEQELSNSEERKKYVQTQSYLKKASEKLDKLEAQSQGIIVRIEALKAQYAEVSETLKDFDNLEDLVEGEGSNLTFYKRNITQVIEQLKTLKAEINGLVAVAKDVTEEYQSLKQKVIKAQAQYPELRTAYQNLKNEKQGEMDAITAELAKLSKGLDEAILKKYQAKRSERIFPILCVIKADRCSKCGMELSIADKEKVTAGKLVECEHCHRLLYKA